MKLNKTSFRLLIAGGALFLASCNGDSSSSTTSSTGSGTTASNQDSGSSGRSSNGANGDTSSTSSSNGTNGANGTNGNSTDGSQDNGKSKNSGSMANANQQAIDYAVMKNTKELIWLHAAVERGTNPEIKSHAKMMITDHKNLGEKVSALISKKNYTKPSVDTTNEVNINTKSGADWDKAWVSKMIADHTELLTMLGKAKESVTDTELKQLITNTIPVVQKHLDMARMLDKKIK